MTDTTTPRVTLTDARTLLKQAEQVAVTDAGKALLLHAWRRSGSQVEMPSEAMLTVAAEIVALASHDCTEKHTVDILGALQASLQRQEALGMSRKHMEGFDTAIGAVEDMLAGLWTDWPQAEVAER